MWVVILSLLILILGCYSSYKYGEIHELHKARACFEHYLEAHPYSKELLLPGLEAAENLVKQLEEEETYGLKN